ncbi:rho GTPase-activating protein SYDE1 [Alligator mississippiensis]|uniref:Rho GTPase-activating protein SYDE1 n=1 Tax=Alligator mississippiensis TaxID=8496 RepID=A0A151NV31_ALLMI|nr:rho GTPase-activating protein SYDE1 [Alligator mississippiensis]KYO40772.1 hypothetical protein Y1Q_0009448 [Alligator mississippiensis]
MAEPLLRRTFSRLRGRERLRRKKSDAKERERPLRTPDSPVELVPETGPSSEVVAAPDPDGGCRKGAAITVSKKQNWARFSCGVRDEPRVSCRRKGPVSSKASPEPQDEGDGRSPDESPQSPGQPRLLPSSPHMGELAMDEEDGGPGEGPLWPDGPRDEEAESLCSYAELGAAAGAMKGASHGAYLQSLERSSRHWVLSSGKALGPDESAPSTRAEQEPGAMGSEGEIWYNPIPEDEDVVGTRQNTEPWRRWGSVASAQEPDQARMEPPHKPSSEAPSRSRAGGAESHSARTGLGPDAASQGKDEGAGRAQSCGKAPTMPCMSAEAVPGGPSPPPSPGAAKKGRALGRAKSPGTVRRLSMKMKKLPELRRKLSLRSTRTRGPEAEGGGAMGSTSPRDARKESGNVISRYHLDSSVEARPGLPRGKAASKGGYLSDGDSPELLAKSDKHTGAEPEPGTGPGLDVSSFQSYSFVEQPRCVQQLSGLVSVHLYGLQDLRALRAEAREVFCVLQVDAAHKARTALLPGHAAFLRLNHTFNLELEGAQLLKVVVFSWDPAAGRNRVCCHGTIILPHIFRGSRVQQLALQLEPRGILYVKLTLVEQWDMPNAREPRVFGVELRQLVERENAVLKVPLLIQKCVARIERCGLKVVGLYRLCGSAAVKKELRDAFERDSAAVTLSEQLYPDINVITGILKDYLRELPTPLITPTLYHVVLEAMARRPPRAGLSEREAMETVALLDCLPDIEKATLTMLLDHLSLVASFHDFNRMHAQNLAVCFGPVLLSQSQDPRRPGARSYAHCEDIASAVDFKRHIEVLHYLLQAWPVPHRTEGPEGTQSSCLRPKRHPALRLELLESQVVARHRPRGLESPPSNRYAGDWSVCGQEFLLLPGPGPGSGPGGEADYDEVAGSDSEGEGTGLGGPSRTIFMGDFALVDDPEAPFSPRLNLKDFDALILDLERELSKPINVCL